MVRGTPTQGGVVMGRKSDVLTFGRKLHDIGRVVVEAVHDAGGNDEDAERIFGDTLHRQIGQLVMGKLKLSQHPCQIHAPELIQDWCKEIVEDVEPTDFHVKDLDFVAFLNEGDAPVSGSVMRKSAVALKANFGLSDAKRMLAEQADFPVDMRRKCIVLTGTVIRGPVGRLYVAYIHCDGVHWFRYRSVSGA